MSDKLRKMLKHYFSKPYSIYGEKATEKIMEQILSWHKSERKKWALGLVGEELKEGTLKYRSVTKHEMRGYNQAKAEIRKKIEEG